MRRLSGFIVVGALSACGGDSGTTPDRDTVVASVSIAPDSLLLQVGQPFYLTAIPRNAAGHAITGLTATWSSSALPVATVEPNGVITAVGVGSSVVTATVGTHSTTMELTVIPTVRRVSVSPPDATVEMGYTLQLSLVLLDEFENQIHATVTTTWSSSNNAKATVSATGVVTPHDTGTITITGGMSTGNAALQYAATTLTIVPHVTVVSVDILPNPVGLIVGQTRTLAAFARDHNGTVIVGRPFAWSSQGPTVASAGATTGLVTALLAGAAQISAVTEGISGSVGVTVFAATSAPGIGTALTAGNLASQFVSIPAGTFAMGATDGTNDEKPVRQVTLTSAFQMQKTEVTRAQWLAVMPASSLPPGNAGCDLCPVIGITWDQAQAFIVALNLALPGNIFRLPTEAQWERAARGNTDTAYPGVLEFIAEYFITSDTHVWPVALRLPNAFGLYDVIGNASEWTLDFYASGYNPAELIDPVGPASGTKHVDRGGSCSSTAFLARSSYRTGAPVDQIGLRLVRN